MTGSVKLNGQPVDGAMVTFQMTEGKGNAIGSTDAKGEFVLSTFSPNDGAVPGQYKVAISKLSAPPPSTPTLTPGQMAPPGLSDTYVPPSVDKAGAGAGGPKSLIPAKYSNDATSALRATVTEQGPNRFDFDLQ